MPVSIVLGAKRRVMKQSGDRRGPDRTRAPRVGDRAPAPPAPEGLAGLRIASYAAHVSGPPADVVVFMNTGTKPASGLECPEVRRVERPECRAVCERTRGDSEVDLAAARALHGR